MNKLILFLNFLKTASCSNKKYVLIKYNSILQNILYVLYAEGVVQSYSKKKINGTEFLIVFLRYYQNKSNLSEISVLFNKKKKTYLKYKEIIFLNEKKKLFFLSTKKGIKTSLDCKLLKIGGFILFSC